jgi:methylene-fatty-acyl-phospholipid synthase
MSEPMDALALLFYFFKALQITVFFAWCYAFADGSIWPRSVSIWSIAAGAALIAAGQSLNISVFYRLGKIGVFYGNKFGYKIPWSREFPFSFCEHPQYLGALLSIWGFFLIMRFPHGDWYFLPALETIYYGLGAYLER